MTKYQLLPPLADDDLGRLKASIVERGVKIPVVLDEDGEILDGHNRVMIADSLGIEYPRIVEAGLDEHEKRIFVAELNAARRQLTDAQKVLLGQKIEPDIAARAEKRMKAGKTLVTDVTRVSDPNERKTSAEVARAVQLGSHMAYERGKKVLAELAQEEDGAQLIGHLESGDWELDDARQELRTRRREAEKHEAEKLGASLESVMTPRDRDDLQRARIRSTVSTAIHHVGANLTPLKPEAVADAMDGDRRYQLESFIRKTRVWFDAVEAEMNRGIRVVHRKDA